MTELESLLLWQIREAGLPEPKTQYQFHGTRRWKADFAFPCERVICEVNGATHQASRGHTSFTGLHRDYEKGNAAQLMGYRYFEFDREMIEDGTAIKTICEAMRRCEQ